MAKKIHFEGEDYIVNVYFTYHAQDRMIDRCVSRARIIQCIERGFGYVLDDAEANLSRPENIATELVQSRENFKVILTSRWNNRRTELEIVVITILLDLFNANKNVKKRKHTKIHIV